MASAGTYDPFFDYSAGYGHGTPYGDPFAPPAPADPFGAPASGSADPLFGSWPRAAGERPGVGSADPRGFTSAGSAEWFGGPSQSYRSFDSAAKDFYEANPGQSWQQYIQWGFGDRETPLRQFALGRYAQEYANYLQLSEQDPTGQKTFTDYQTPDVVSHIRSLFYEQTPGQKGYTLQYMPAGRMG